MKPITRAGISDNRQLFNFEQANDTSTTDKDAEFLEPFFLSSGLFSIFGQDFLKVTNLQFTINNNIQDKRFVGVGNKSIKDGIPIKSMKLHLLLWQLMINCLKNCLIKMKLEIFQEFTYFTIR